MQHPQIMFKSPYFLLGLILLVIFLGMQVKFCRLHKPVVGSITCTSHCLGKEAALLHLGNRPKKIAPICIKPQPLSELDMTATTSA